MSRAERIATAVDALQEAIYKCNGLASKIASARAELATLELQLGEARFQQQLRYEELEAAKNGKPQ